jgi:dihydrofolate synthase / folylpolyglutamate synthase
MTYAQTVKYLFSQLPMYQRIGEAAFKANLDNTLLLCERLGNPQNRFRSIHIAGTNGKGSVSHMTAAALTAAGYRVGLYISPHYKDFRERIRINGVYISKRYVINFVEKHKEMFEKIQPSFFEMTVALAFDYFAQQGCDVAIIETGLGGRLDSTNVIHPLLSVITNISFDHMNFLGDTLEKIAFEKAGIIKPKTPVVIGEWQAATYHVFERVAAERNSNLTYASQRFEAKLQEEVSLENEKPIFQITENQQDKKSWIIDAAGIYQEKNIATTLETLRVWNIVQPNLAVKEADIRNGLANLRLHSNLIGRWHILSHSPTIVCDSAHNESGLQIAMRQLEQLPKGTLHFVLGMVNDKDIATMLALLPKDAVYYFTKANIPRALAPDLLQKQANVFGLNGKTYSTVKRALAAAKRRAQANDVIYVGGSTFVVAEVI